MKKILKKERLIFLFAFLSFLEAKTSLAPLLVLSNLSIDTMVANDKSGNVPVTTTADNALAIYVVFFKEDEEPGIVNPGQEAKFRYKQLATYSQLITIVA